MAPTARILAIDDQLYSRSFLEGLLAEEGYDICTAGNRAEGLERIARDGPFDLVIMDLVAPGQEGVQTVAEIRRSAADQAIIVLTGVGDVRSVVAAMRQGAADYLLKPIDREGLLQAIEGVLSQRRMRAENEKLVDENLAFMGQLSLHERALALLTVPDLSTVAQGVLDVLAVEAGAPDAVLWLRDPRGDVLALMATRGDIAEGAETVAWKTHDDKLDAKIRGGEMVAIAPDPPRPARLFVPFVAESGELFAVARLSAPGPLAVAGHETGQKLCGLVLANALRNAQLAAQSLVEPKTGLPTRAYLEEVTSTEIQKAQRFGRRLACLCIEIRGLHSAGAEALAAVVEAMRRTLRSTDILCSEDGRRFWVLVTDTDSLGGVVLKRRLAERVTDAVKMTGMRLPAALGVSSYPLDAETTDALIETAINRVVTEKVSLVHELGLDSQSSLGEIGTRLLDRAEMLPGRLVREAAELVVSDLTCRPRDRGLLFLAPGPDAPAMLGPLGALGDAETSTEVYIATDGDTVPSGAALTAVALPSRVSPSTTMIVRFGDAPSYALVAGPPRTDGQRPVFHTADPVLVEHMTFRLRGEVGFGVPA